jgi:hypothetical protein
MTTKAKPAPLHPLRISLEDEIITELSSTFSDTQLNAINQMRKNMSPTFLAEFRRKADLFSRFERILVAVDGWEVQHQCIRLIGDMMPMMGKVGVVDNQSVLIYKYREAPNSLLKLNLWS